VKDVHLQTLTFESHRDKKENKLEKIYSEKKTLEVNGVHKNQTGCCFYYLVIALRLMFAYFLKFHSFVKSIVKGCVCLFECGQGSSSHQ